MNLPVSLSLIQNGIAMSKQLLDHAAADEWEQFFELETQRHAALIGLKLEPVGPTAEQYQQIREQMTVLIDLNNQLEEVCKQQRSMLADHLRQFNKNNKAHKAYSAAGE
jgi:hypothetical protein